MSIANRMPSVWTLLTPGSHRPSPGSSDERGNRPRPFVSSESALTILPAISAASDA